MVTARGERQARIARHLAIKPEAVDPDDVEMLADMVVAAVNAALRIRGGRRSNATMGKLTGGMGMPGLF